MRFTIRDVLWLTVVVGLAVAWWTERSNAITARQELAKAHLYWDGEHEKYLELLRTMPPQPNRGRIGGGGQ
jgi:hypothetical protein